MRYRLIAAAALLVAFACGSSRSTIGPLTVEPPDGWLAVDREADTLKVTNGTIGEETGTRQGDATAVFDVFVNSSQTVREFRKVLKENNVRYDEEAMEIDGYDAMLFSYRTTAFAPSSEVVFVPEWNVRIVYRAAYGDEEAAFERYRPDFREALRSITFEGEPPDRA